MVTNVLLFIHPMEVRLGEFVKFIQTHPFLESKGWRARKELAGINVEIVSPESFHIYKNL